MRTLEPPNRVRIGLMGIVVTVLVIGVGQSFTSVPMLFAKPSYYGQFTDSGGINTGDKVRIAGLDVGKVEGIKIDGDHIRLKFSIGTNTIGTESRLAIKTDTILGKKILDVEARGNQPLRPGASLPLGQSTTPYQIYDAFFDVTKAAQGWDIDTVKQSLHVLSQTIDQTYPHLSPALEGVAKFSDTIGKRDEEVKHLLAQANQVAGVLGIAATRSTGPWSMRKRSWPPSTSAARPSTPCWPTSPPSPNRSRGCSTTTRTSITCSSNCARSATSWCSAKTTWPMDSPRSASSCRR